MPADIKMLVAESKTKEALKVLRNRAQQANDGDLENSVITLIGNFTKLRKDMNNGVILSSAANIAMNKINMAILSMADDLPSPENENHIISPIINPENLKEMEIGEIMGRIQTLMEKRRFFQEQYDIASDASQKFNLQKNITEMTEQLEALKTKLS